MSWNELIMLDHTRTTADLIHLPSWKIDAPDWTMAAASLCATLDDPTTRRAIRLADLQSQVQELTHRARHQQQRTLLGTLNRIDQELVREQTRGSANLARLRRLCRYFQRRVDHLEWSCASAPTTIAVHVGGRPLPGLLEGVLRRNGFGTRSMDLDNPDLILLKDSSLLIYLTDQEYPKQDLARLQALKKQMLPSARLLMVSERDDFSTRAAAIRADIDHLITQPIDSARLHALLTEVRGAGTGDDEQVSVLLVDDMQTTGMAWRKPFSRANLRLLFETRPRAAFETALAESPDVILLDLYMPEMNGIDLARLFREHPQLSDVPILFLSTEERDRPRLEAKLKGGDDFLNKNIASKDLIRMVRYRAQRYRQMRAARRSDSLTGLLNHHAITTMVDHELDRAIRQEQPLSVVMIDIDHFKAVNDRHGHPTGDRVIRRLATLLNTQLRKYDGVGRCGGEEFMLVLPATTIHNAIRLVDRLRQQFASLATTTTGGDTIHCQFSAGVAGYPGQITPQEIIDATDAALYRAKRSGRDQVRPSHGEDD